MKRILLLALLFILFFTDCNKQVANIPVIPQPSPPLPPTNYLMANAGNDTSICIPYGGTGNEFRAFLDGRASLDDSGKIISYSWYEILGVNDAPLTDFSDSTNYSKDSAEVNFLLSGGVHLYMLKVMDDHGRIDSAHVTVNAIQNFSDEFDGLSWDSTTGGLTTISVKFKPGLMETWPSFYGLDSSSGIYLSNYSGACFDTSNLAKLPFVPYDSIQLTNETVFYSIVNTAPTLVDQGSVYPEIYARTNSGIDFNKKVSIGFIEVYPPEQNWKILPKKLLRQIRTN